ncbi:PREDICTED: cortactin-binding protein 2-like [Amphimedon queenslandica]|uniref:CortBP2/NAV1-like AAA+ ATPase lid domain-containing protein n=1 Tax=Amphimedon queenslandica TaxID=400682 RepID=A0A1X7UW53_AMPQE|nr:PREDICTED: cortactin-binding protein 2-like [Amphimedon queenslandica]|eukprot:XP_019851946.1 PREDICTED: cortactin-binding protein 2-like [Amphimedon queenslandica]
MEKTREDLSNLLSLEKELRFAAEAEAEAQKQALLQLLVCLKDKLEPEPPGEEQQDYTRSASSSSSVSNFPPALPRAFSREFYDAVLQEMPDEVQETLAPLQQKDTSTSDSSSFDKACAAIKLGNYKQLVAILQDNTDSRSASDSEREALLQYGTQLLHLAVEERSINCVQVLLKGGVSPNESGLSSLPPLHTAANNGFKSCIKVLLQYGAEVDLQDSKGQTPLYIALVAGQTDCVQLLLKSHSPGLSLLTTGGRSLFHAAVSSCLDNELRLLLVSIRASLPPQSVSSLLNGQEFSTGYTPLHIAAEKKHMKCLMVLLSCPEVNPNLMSFDGRTALDLVTGSPDCTVLLSTRNHKEALVLVHEGHSFSSSSSSSSSSSGDYRIGRIKLLTHHNWDDLKWLVSSCFKEFEYSQKYNERFENKFTESDTYLNQKRLIGTIDEDLNQLCQTDSVTLLQEMKDVLSKRCSSFKPLNDLSSAMKDIKIGQYTWSTGGWGSERRGCEGRSPYEALVELEEAGELLEIEVHLDNGYQRISYTSMIPQDVLEKYTNQLLKSKCVIIHGPLEIDLNQISGHIAASLKSVTSAKIDKIHIPLRPSYTRAHLVSLLYDNGILIPCSESAETTSDSPHSSLLVMEGVDKIQYRDVLYTLSSLLEHYSTGESIYLDLNDNNEESFIPTGNYKLSEQCYVIATRTLFTKSGSGLPREVMESYAHIWLCDSEEPILGQLYRTYFKELVHINKGTLPLKSDYVYQAVVWVWQFWLIYNYYIQQLGLHELTLGVKLFLNCPVLSNNADSIYNWFAELWSFHVIPKLKEHLLTTNQQKKQEATFKSLVFFIIHRLISSTCPLPPQALKDFLSALYSFSDNDLLFVPPGQSTAVDKSARDTKSPKIKRTYSKKSISSIDLAKTNQWVSVAAAVKSIEDLSASTGDLNKPQRPRSGSFFSKNSTLRRSLFKGSRASLYALEEEDGKGSGKSSSGKLKRKKKKELDQEKKESMDELFDVMMSSDERMDDQRVTKAQAPHHVISVQSSTTSTPPANHSPSHSLSDKLESIRPLSAEGNTSPVAKLSSDQSLNKIRQTRHPRISNLLEAHSLPQVLSRSDENVYHTVSMVSPSSDSPRPFSASTAPYHPRQISTASSGYSDSRRSSTDSLSNSFNSDLMRNTSYNSTSEFKRTSSLDGIIDDTSSYVSGQTNGKTTSVVNENGLSSQPISGSNDAESCSVDVTNKETSNGLPVVVSPRTRRFSRSYQALYSASLGACASDALQKSRKLSLPTKVGSDTYQSPKKPHNQRMSTSLLSWRLEESVVEM